MSCQRTGHFVQDNDCHWYLIPEHRMSEFEGWVAQAEDGSEDPDLFEGDRLSEHPSAYVVTIEGDL